MQNIEDGNATTRWCFCRSDLILQIKSLSQTLSKIWLHTKESSRTISSRRSFFGYPMNIFDFENLVISKILNITCATFHCDENWANIFMRLKIISIKRNPTGLNFFRILSVSDRSLEFSRNLGLLLLILELPLVISAFQGSWVADDQLWWFSGLWFPNSDRF